MSDVVTEVVCSECGNKSAGTDNFCGVCGAEDPWVEQAKYDMDDVDFPVIVEYEVYDDHGEMWNRFCAQLFDVYDLKGSQIANVPSSLPRMKYTAFSVYYKITKSERKGPFLSKQEAREA
jgi:hypothetical protein